MVRDLSYRAMGRRAAWLDLPCLTTNGEGRAGGSTSDGTAWPPSTSRLCAHRSRASDVSVAAARGMAAGATHVSKRLVHPVDLQPPSFLRGATGGIAGDAVGPGADVGA